MSHSTSRRATAGAVGLALLLTGTVGCAVGTGGSAQKHVDFSRSAKLSGTLSAMGFGAGDEVATSRIALAKKAMPGVQVKLTEGDLDLQQFLSAVATGAPPDLVYADRDQIGSLAARGAIIPLDDCISGEKIPKGDFAASALDQVTLQGHIYGIPEFNTIQLTMANSSLLGAAGLSLDDVNGSDWQAMAAAAKKLTKTNGGKLSVIGVDTKLPEFLPLWAKANGADLISSDGKKAQLDSKKVVEALTWAVSIYNDEGGFSKVKAYRDSADFFGKGNQYATNVLGAMPMEQWYINVLNDVSPSAPVAFDTVRSRDGKTIAYASGSAWAIPKGAKNPKGACRWARVMTSQDAWKAAAEARIALRKKDGKPFTGILTGNTKADEMIQGMVTKGGEPWDTAVTKMYEANKSSFSLPADPADAEFTQAWQDAVNSVLNGQATPEAALSKAQSTAQKALDDAWGKLDGK